MARRTIRVVAVVTVGVLVLFANQTRGAIRYTVSVAHPEQHLLRVTMEVSEVKDELKLQMAAWNALYEIRDFSSHVQKVDATVNGQHTAIDKLDKLTWCVRASGTVKVSYATFWNDVGPFSTQLNSEHAFINPALILLYVPDRRAEVTELVLRDVPSEWNVVASTLLKVDSSGSARQFNFRAESFDALADGPIEASKFEEFTIHDLTPPVQVVVHGDGWKRRDLETALRKICTYELKLMEGAPYQQYTFIFHIGKQSGGSGGGMEHANSTAIFAPSDAFLWNVSAHEFFHLWNVKRIRPATLEPVDYTREMYTRALWFAEGVTNTYGSYTLVRTGLWDKLRFYQDLGSQISELESRPANHWQSVEQSSLDAWLEKYAFYTQPSRSVSYYTKGQVLGVLLDILIRERTENQKSLDDVLRAMNTDFAKEGRFYRDSLDVKLTAEKIAGGSLDDFFSKYVGGAEPLPYEKILGMSGIELRAHEIVHPVLGFLSDREPDVPLVVRAVDPEGSAAKAGLRSGDEIVRWNDSDPPKRPERWVLSRKPGDEIRLRVRRESKEAQVVMRVGQVRENDFELVDAPNATQREKQIREGILKGTTSPVTAKNQ